ncbi:hypothetical protein LCGC14_2223430 [marine sediment metagenome]|uniref:Uncharacterized protein n=1 Tax=marine sediment metagenome TaxID=412755 RepID=A0A0F9FMV0_9ZZZZ
MPLTPEEIEERLIALEERLERRLRSGKAFTTNPLALATDLDDLGSVKTHLDFEEAPLTPGNPLTDVIRLYALDVGGTTNLATRDVNGLGRTRRMSMSVESLNVSGTTAQTFWADAATIDNIYTCRIPSDWVEGTDITVNVFVYQTATGGGPTMAARSFLGLNKEGDTVSVTNFDNDVDISLTLTQNIVTLITRTVTGTSIEAGDTIRWIVRRLGGAAGDTVNTTVSGRIGAWIDYTAFF